MRGRRTIVATLATLAALAAPAGASACHRWAAPSGNDGSAGTRGAPFRTITHLADSLRPGQTGCLVPGQTFREHVAIRHGGRAGAPIRILTPGTKPDTLVGTVWFSPGGHDAILAMLRIQGDGSRSKAIVSISGNRASLVRVDVSGPGYTNSNIACVRVEGNATGVRLERDSIHACTRVTTHKVHSQGVVVAHGSNTVLTDSFVYHITGDAVVLAPSAQKTLVTHVIVDGNSAGVLIGGGKQSPSSGNRIVDSILSFSGKWNVHSWWAGRPGSGNVVTSNCIWRGFHGNIVGTGFSAYGNLVTAPRYTNRPASLSIRQGPCFGKRPRPWYLAQTDLGLPWPRVNQFTVHYVLRAKRTQVEVVQLRVTGLGSRAPLELRCVRGCTTKESLRATTGGDAASAFLPGQWLPRGSVVELRERRAGRIGAYARVEVTGLPHGVAISHACLSPLEQQRPFSCGYFG